MNHVSDIVLTREDYLRYSNSKAALAGIVQSLLITKHFLFVGFSLTDDNFLKVVDGVRQAIGPNPSKKTFGSATFLFENSLFSELWSDIDLISMMKGSSFRESQCGRVGPLSCSRECFSSRSGCRQHVGHLARLSQFSLHGQHELLDGAPL